MNDQANDETQANSPSAPARSSAARWVEREALAKEFEDSMSEHWSNHEVADFIRSFSSSVDAASLEKRVIGALKSCIDAHGAITKERVGSAAKRIVNLLTKGD